MCLESGLVELIDNNCQQSSAAPFTAESPCLSRSLSVSRHCHFIVSDNCKGVVYLAQAKRPLVPRSLSGKASSDRDTTKEKRSPLCCTVSHSTQAPRSSRWPPGLLGCFVLLRLFIHLLTVSPLACLGVQRCTTKRFTATTYCRPAFLNSALPGCRVAFVSALCLSVLSEWTRLRAIHCPTPGLAAPGLGDPSLAIFPANLTSFTFAPETWPRYGYRLHSSTSPFPSTFAFLIFIRIFDPTSSNSRKIRIESHC